MIQFPDNLCMHCFSPMGQNGICPACGCKAGAKNAPAFLAVKTVLDGQYLVGSLLRSNGESAVYTALSGTTGTPVEIREFFPANLAGRTGFQLIPKPGQEIQYKACLSDFIDLHRTLGRLNDIPLLCTILDLFEANGTVYVVSEPPKGIPFSTFLSVNTGELSWEQARELLLPLMASLQHFHDLGVCHLGISPETLYVSKNGELNLVDFCLPAARTVRSELPAELAPGYAAPEQYASSGWDGRAADVYALGALLYRTLTGTQLVPASSRTTGEQVFPAFKLNPMIPKGVSDILSTALDLNPSKRIATVSDLRLRLANARDSSEQVGDTRRVTSQDEVRKAEKQAERKQKLEEYERYLRISRRRRRRRPHYGLLTGLVCTVLLCSGVFYLLHGMYKDKKAGENSSSAVSSVSASEYLGSTIVPSLVGSNIDEVSSNREYKGVFSFYIVYVASAEYAEDVIIDQSPRSGESVEVGSVINLKVSKGIQTVEMPDVVGKTQEEAIKLLDLIEIDFEIIPVYEDGWEKGVVARANYSAGETLTLSRDTVYLFVNQQEPKEEEESSSGEDDGWLDSLFD